MVELYCCSGLCSIECVLVNIFYCVCFHCVLVCELHVYCVLCVHCMHFCVCFVL
jgi:hypothetical protein